MKDDPHLSVSNRLSDNKILDKNEDDRVSLITNLS